MSMTGDTPNGSAASPVDSAFALGRANSSSGWSEDTDIPLWARIETAIRDRLTGLWNALPLPWMPAVFRIVFAAAGCLPPGSRVKLRNLIARLRAASASMNQDYPYWLGRYERNGPAQRRDAAAHIGRLTDPPSISVLMPAGDPPLEQLQAATESLRAQFYPKWELLVADGSPAGSPVAAWLRDIQAQESRIRSIRPGANPDETALRNAVFGLATGSFVTLLRPPDRLSPWALYQVAVAISAQPDVDIVYADEDSIDGAGRRSMPFFKPDWNPELMLGLDLIGPGGVFRRSLVERAGGFRADMDSALDYDLALRAVDQTAPDRIRHIPRVLYHRQAGRPACSAGDARRAVQASLSRGTSGGRVEPSAEAPDWIRTIYPVPRPEPLVSVIIPSRNHADMLARVADGLLHRTDYPALDILIADNGSDEPEALALLNRLALDHRVRVLRCPGPFNYAALNNRAVGEAAGSLVLLLNNDIDPIGPGWLREMVSHAIRPGIGAVGARLLYPDRTVQHGGVVAGLFGVADHQYLQTPDTDPGYFGQLKLARNITAVTAACLLVRRDLYLEAGGLDDIRLPVAFNDVDFCLKLAEKGYRNLWTPHAELYHLESASRGADRSAAKSARLKREMEYVRQRWGRWLANDPQWNPNLSLQFNGVALAFPPRDPTGDRPTGLVGAAGFEPTTPSPPD